MGLLLSVLVGCVGVLELLACLRHVTDGVVITINPPATPCLSYHEQVEDNNLSIHDSLCSYSHSNDVSLPAGARRKLENLHEYSLRVRTELRSLDKSFDCNNTLSECSTRDLLDGSRPDSRLSPDFEHLVEESEANDTDQRADDRYDEYQPGDRVPQDLGDEKEEKLRVEGSSQDRPLALVAPAPEKYVRVPTPIPYGVDDEELSESSSEVDTSFDNDSGNEAPSMKTFDGVASTKRTQYKELTYDDASSADDSDRDDGGPSYTGKTHEKSAEAGPSFSHNAPDSAGASRAPKGDSSPEVRRFVSQKKRATKSSTTTVRKPRFRSRNTEVSKSAENLSARRSKKRREPERRKSDISVQTTAGLSRDESTNTSPLGSPALSRAESKRSVSVMVQTSFEEKLSDEEPLVELGDSVVGLSESRRDLTSGGRDGRRSFKSRRFGSTSRDRSEEDGRRHGFSVTNATTTVERPLKDKSELLKISSFEDADDEDYDRLRNFIADGGDPVEGNCRWRQGSSVSADEEEDFMSAEDLIFSGEYTKAMNKDWHSGHFCCWQCDESLTGQRYVLRDEHPYCIKCYESVFANGCEECNKIIGIDSKDLSYKDKHWHEACFLCNRCRVSLVDKQFGSKVDKIYCGNCYDAQFASRCDGCGEIFRAGTKKMEYKTRQWHEKCFCCVVCKNPIGTKSFIPREQEIYCAGCYEDKFATRCVKCNKIITSGGVTYKNEPWHRDCFTCSNCNNSLAGQRFTSRDDKPYCADCFGELFAKRCTACSKPITGIGGTRFISFEDRHWHNDCFICAGCKTSLVGRGFITDAEDIICPECAKMKLM